MCRDVQVKEFRSGYIRCQLNSNLSKNFLKEFKEKLKQLTQMNWEINIDSEGDGQSLLEKKTQAQQETLDRFLKISSVQKLCSVFPEAEVSYDKKN